MPPLQIITVVFNIPVFPRHIREFRAAISSLVTEQLKPAFKRPPVATDWFHNHNEKTGKNINRYPLIQYKLIERRAAITGMAQGAEALSVLLRELGKKPQVIEIAGRRFHLFIYKLEKQQHIIKPLEEYKEYRLYKWLPMDDESFKEWEHKKTLKKRIEVLDGCLQRQLGRFLLGINHKAKKEWKAAVTNILHSGWQHEYNFTKMCFDIAFRCNISLPEEVGIGQVPSIGFGRILASK